MAEAFVFGVVVMVVSGVVGLAVAAVLFALWIFVLPFQLLGIALKSVGFLLALPFIVILGLIGVLVFGVGMLVFLLPVLPIVALGYLMWLWLRPPRRPSSA